MFPLYTSYLQISQSFVDFLRCSTNPTNPLHHLQILFAPHRPVLKQHVQRSPRHDHRGSCIRGNTNVQVRNRLSRGLISGGYVKLQEGRTIHNIIIATKDSLHSQLKKILTTPWLLLICSLSLPSHYWQYHHDLSWLLLVSPLIFTKSSSLFSSYHLWSKNPNRSSWFVRSMFIPSRLRGSEAKRVACKSPSIAFEALPLASVHVFFARRKCRMVWLFGWVCFFVRRGAV